MEVQRVVQASVARGGRTARGRQGPYHDTNERPHYPIALNGP